MPNIFISYRRGDAAGHAGRLFDSLSARYGRDRVFMDRDSITPGVDFVERIDEALASCEAAVIVIGEDWIRITGPDGRRRLDDPADYVRTEVVASLARSHVRVVPVLVGGAPMPSAS